MTSLNTYLLSALGILIGAVITGLVAWKAAKRQNTTDEHQHSGTIDTSEAASLWQEGASLRDNLTQQVVTLTSTVVGLRVQLIDTSSQLTSTSTHLAEASTQITRLLHDLEASNVAADLAREETRRAREEISQLRGAIKDVHDEVKTGNALTMGALADNAESRRIALIPDAERTHAEHEHIDTVGIQTVSPTQPEDQK